MTNRKKFEGIIILSDLDGTLLNTSRKVPSINLEKIEYFKQNGGLFTYNTGRAFFSIAQIIPNTENIVNAPVITCNGASLYDFSTKKSVVEKFIDFQSAKTAVGFALEHYPDVYLEISTPDGLLTDRYDKYVLHDYPHVPFVPVIEKTFDEMTVKNWYKVVFRGKMDDLDKLRVQVFDMFGDKFEYCNSEYEFFEICGKGYTKASMIDDFRTYFKDKLSENMKIYAVGDYENDIPMLKAADVACCPANAIDSVKEICQVKLVSCNDGAIADLIDYLDRTL